jgi:hypothetical protein
LQEICGGSIVTSQTYTNTPTASGNTFTDNINLATASSLFQYAFSRGAIPTYSVTGIALNQTAVDNGFTKPGNNSIGFSKTGSGTVGGIATITGTYDKQDGNGNTTSFSLALTLSEVCTVSAKTMNTDEESLSIVSGSSSPPFSVDFDIFNATYFRYTDNTEVSSLTITELRIENQSTGGIWSWYHPEFYGSSATYNGINISKFGNINLGSDPFYGGYSSFSATVSISGTYDNFLGSPILFTKSIILYATLSSGGGGSGGGGGGSGH